MHFWCSLRKTAHQSQYPEMLIVHSVNAAALKTYSKGGEDEEKIYRIGGNPVLPDVIDKCINSVGRRGGDRS
jgi:hypothetical protein